jgi:hypothetical protein
LRNPGTSTLIKSARPSARTDALRVPSSTMASSPTMPQSPTHSCFADNLHYTALTM